MKQSKIIRSLELQATNIVMTNCYLNIIESHLIDAISNDDGLKARKYSELKRMAMQELKEYDCHISVVIHK